VILVALLLAATYSQDIAAWRAQREARLRADEGWLTVVGFHWLKPGPNSVGTRDSDDVALPPGAAPERAGTVDVKGREVRFRFADGRVSEFPVAVGRLKLLLLERGGRFAIRVKDNESEQRKRFTGCRWFPVSEKWRVTARFVPAPKKLRFSTAVGTVEEMDSPGYVEFEWGGKTHRLEPAREDDQLFFVFADATTAKETYGGGRFLYTGMPRDGRVVLDFNKAENPPCAFTPYATCPRPPQQNRLGIAVTAGERTR
jgi:uncharacterized protein (DUF1684 family)